MPRIWGETTVHFLSTLPSRAYESNNLKKKSYQLLIYLGACCNSNGNGWVSLEEIIKTEPFSKWSPHKLFGSINQLTLDSWVQSQRDGNRSRDYLLRAVCAEWVDGVNYERPIGLSLGDIKAAYDEVSQ